MPHYLLSKIANRVFLAGLLLVVLALPAFAADDLRGMYQAGLEQDPQEQDTSAQADIGDDEAALRVRVLFESAFVRALPTQEADAVASVFENEVLEAMGRNVDGTWLQVRRANRDVSLGWIARRLVALTFDIGELPLTDFETGVVGDEPVFDTGFSLLILTEANLRAEPNINSEVIDIVPLNRILPLIDRNPDGRWFRVNYLGTVGWLSLFSVRVRGEVEAVPINPETVAQGLQIEIIPPDVQLAQAIRLRDYATPIYATAQETSAFWGQLADGLVIPCNPPAGNFPVYEYTQRDVYELPELRRATRRLDTAISDLNASLATMQRCGIYSPSQISRAYAQAINATNLLANIIQQMNNVEAFLLPQLN